jgi:hypothetical protein
VKGDLLTKIERSVEINAPIEKVFVFLANPKNQEKIFVDSEFKIEDISKQPYGVGTKFRISALMGGRKVKPHWHEFAEFENNCKIVDQEVKGGALKKERLTFLLGTTDKGTKLTITEDYELPYSVLGKLVDKLAARKSFELLVVGGTRRTKEILEAT